MASASPTSAAAMPIVAVFNVDGETFAALTSRVGIIFDEQVEARSAHAGSVRDT